MLLIICIENVFPHLFAKLVSYNFYTVEYALPFPL